MRRHEKDFLLRGSGKYVDRLTAEGESFANLLHLSNLDGEEREIIRGHLQVYLDTFMELVEVAEMLVDEEGNFNEAAEEFGPVLQTLRETKAQTGRRVIRCRSECPEPAPPHGSQDGSAGHAA